jgi:CheY-like chemotaxis protein
MGVFFMSRLISVLLVEDNEDDVVLINEAFDQQDMLTIAHTVNNGEEAMAYLNKQGKYADVPLPSLVLLDINMPRMNGFEVLEAVKSSPHLQHVPMIMLTTSEREEDIVRSFASGARSYIRKPTSLGAMIKIIDQFSAYWTDVSKVPPTERS